VGHGWVGKKSSPSEVEVFRMVWTRLPAMWAPGSGSHDKHQFIITQKLALKGKYAVYKFFITLYKVITTKGVDHDWTDPG
jgi:hypothetical protein